MTVVEVLGGVLLALGLPVGGFLARRFHRPIGATLGRIPKATRSAFFAPVGIDPKRYRRDPLFGERGLEYIEHLDGVDWYDASPPPKLHVCWAQTRGFVNGYVERCACAGITLDRPGSGDGRQYWMERNQRTRDETSN